MLNREIEKCKENDYIGIPSDFDAEKKEDLENEYFIKNVTINRKLLDYNINKMCEIIHKRDFNNWSLTTIHHHYTKIYNNNSGQMQLKR